MFGRRRSGKPLVTKKAAWDLVSYEHNFTANEAVNFIVNIDPEGAGASDNATTLLRAIGRIDWVVTGGTVDFSSDASIAHGYVVSAQENPAVLDAGATQDADKAWLAWSLVGMPMGGSSASIPELSSGQLFSGYDLRFDWKVRGGKGSTLLHDGGFFYAISLDGVGFGGGAGIFVKTIVKQLWYRT